MPLIPYYLWGVTSPPQNTEKRCPKDTSDCLLGNQKYWLKFVVFFPFFRHVLIIFSLRGVWLVLIVDAWIIHYNYQVKFMRAIDFFICRSHSRAGTLRYNGPLRRLASPILKRSSRQVMKGLWHGVTSCHLITRGESYFSEPHVWLVRLWIRSAYFTYAQISVTFWRGIWWRRRLIFESTADICYCTSRNVFFSVAEKDQTTKWRSFVFRQQEGVSFSIFDECFPTQGEV